MIAFQGSASALPSGGGFGCERPEGTVRAAIVSSDAVRHHGDARLSRSLAQTCRQAHGPPLGRPCVAAKLGRSARFRASPPWSGRELRANRPRCRAVSPGPPAGFPHGMPWPARRSPRLRRKRAAASQADGRRDQPLPRIANARPRPSHGPRRRNSLPARTGAGHPRPAQDDWLYLRFPLELWSLRPLPDPSCC